MNGKSRFLFAALASFALGYVSAAEVRQVFRPERLDADATNIRPLQPIDDAAWIWMPGDDIWGEDAVPEDAWSSLLPKPCSRFYRFRRRFASDGAPLTLDISADERFVLLLDGRQIARGPHRGMVSHWYYQSYEISGLTSGEHILEAICWQIGGHAPIAQLSWRGGFVLKAEGAYDAQLTTGKAAWQVGRLVNTTMTDRGKSGTYGVGSQCEIAGTSFVSEEPTSWTDAKVVRSAIVRNPYGGRRRGWMLFPTERPDPMYEPKTPGRVVNASADLTQPFTVSANTTIDLWWDLDDYYSAYPLLAVSGGKGAVIQWGWTESLCDEKGKKGDRAAWQGKHFEKTMTDTFRADGRGGALFTTPWWRCGRWCRLTMQTADDPLRVERIALAESRYPLATEFSFASDDPSLDAVVKICRRAIENCTHEMIFDCPYYEQQMYPGDTRIQLLVEDMLTHDDRMQRFAISAFDFDRRANGLTAMNFPTRGTQESATYTLCWVMTLRDYAMWRDDERFVRTRMPGVRNALMNLSRYEDADGLLRDLPGWSYLDWVREWSRPDESGVPPGCHFGETNGSLVSILYLNAIRAAAETEEALGEQHLAAHWREKADILGRSLVRLYWDESRGAMADTLDRRSFSEHAQCLAILGGILSPEQERRAFATLAEGTGLSVASSYFAHYLFDAYAREKRTDLILKRLDVWKNYLAHGAKTTFEMQAIETRSDCHGWSASPVYFLGTAFAGIQPAEPFFRSVRIAPQPSSLGKIAATVPSPRGLISVDLAFGDKAGQGRIILPEALSGTYEFNGVHVHLKPGANEIR